MSRQEVESPDNSDRTLFCNLQRQLMKLKKALAPDLHAVTKFEEEVIDFYATAIEYLQRWSASFKKFEVFDWMMLSKIPEWKELEETILYLSENGVEILGDNCFQQYIYLKSLEKKHRIGRIEG